MSADHTPAMEHKPMKQSFAWTAIIVALFGLLMSLYSTSHHFAVKASGVSDAFCNINATFNCDDVAKSKYSEIFNIPLGVWGAGFFLGLMIVMEFGRRKAKFARECIQAYAAFVLIGVAASIALAAISFFQVGAFCLICMGIYAINLVQVFVLYRFRSEVSGEKFWHGMSNGSSYVVIGVAIAIGIFQVFKPGPHNFHEDRPQTEVDSNGQKPQEMPNLAPNRFEFKIDRSAYSGMGEDYRSGSDEAKVVIVEFADFQCPACRGAFEQLKQLKSEFGNSIQVVFKNYPLDNACNPAIPRKMHENACIASTVARCAGQIGKFWDIHNKIYENQKDLSPDNLTKWAKEIGLSDAQLKECQASNDIRNKILDDINLGNQAGVDSTPSLFINGQKLVGQRTPDALRSEILKILNR